MNSRKIILPNEVMLGEVSRLLCEGHSVTIMTKGSSMLPFIRGSRDSVVLEKRTSVKVGDIVLSQLRPGHYVLHRVHAMDADRLTLKGDGNLDAVEFCTTADVCGTVNTILTGDKRRFDCSARSFRILSRCWVASPRIIRRCCLGVYRRITIL